MINKQPHQLVGFFILHKNSTYTNLGTGTKYSILSLGTFWGQTTCFLVGFSGI